MFIYHQLIDFACHLPPLPSYLKREKFGSQSFIKTVNNRMITYEKAALNHLDNTILISILLFLGPQTTVFAGYSVADNTSGALTYSGVTWGTTSDPPALFGSVRSTGTAGDWVSWEFDGDRVAYLYSMAFNRGSTIVEIDGEVVDILDSSANNYQGTEIRRQAGKVYSLSSGHHTIKITNGLAGANNRRFMDLDAFVSDIMYFSPGTYNENASLWVNGVQYWPMGFHGNGWTTTYDPTAYGGSYKQTSITRSGFRINFSGDSIYWFFPQRNDLGKVAVTIDGEDHGILDPYAEGAYYYYWSGLGAGVHLMTVTNTGDTSSSGTVLAIDRFDVGSTATYNRVKAASYADGWAHAINQFWFNYFPENDCQNFASQSLYFGGFPMHPPDGMGLNQDDLTQWWNYFPYGVGISKTWRVVPDFYTYASGRLSEFMIQENNPGYTRTGDLMLLDTDNDRTVDHVKVIVGMGWISPYWQDYDNRLPGYQDLSGTFSRELLTSAHTNSRWHVPVCFNYDCSWLTYYVKIVRTN